MIDRLTSRWDSRLYNLSWFLTLHITSGMWYCIVDTILLQYYYVVHYFFAGDQEPHWYWKIWPQEHWCDALRGGWSSPAGRGVERTTLLVLLEPKLWPLCRARTGKVHSLWQGNQHHLDFFLLVKNFKCIICFVGCDNLPNCVAVNEAWHFT